MCIMSSAARQTSFSSIIPSQDVEILRLAKSVLQAEALALTEISARLDREFCRAIELITQCQGIVVVTGVGKAGLIGQKLTATLSSTGTRAMFLHPTEAVHGDIGCLHENDLVLALSNSGETEELLRIIPMVKQRNIPIVSMTSTSTNRLAQNSNATICYGRLSEAGLHGLPPTTTTTAMMAVGDAMAIVLAQLRGFSAEDFAFVHPAGSLGRQLMQVQELMRTGDELRVACEELSVREVFATCQPAARRTGAIILTDAEGHLTGLFTDSDLARLLERRRDDLLDGPIREVMTHSPLTIHQDLLLREVVEILADRKFSEIPVVDHHNKPVGMIDITDVIGCLPQSEKSAS